MAPNLYTELFFLDEATALASGHRPCFECRREDAGRFKVAWIKGNQQYGFDSEVAINKIDQVIYEQIYPFLGSSRLAEPYWYAKM
jgi:hypothetical protein